MPRDPNKIPIEIQLDPDSPTYKKFLKLVKDKDWSKKKTAEWVISEYFKNKKG